MSLVGVTLGRFRITARLGAGGMGEVYRAEDTRLGREVAVKVLPKELEADPERLARFEREARVLASLSHPRIAAIHEVGSSDGTNFLVMELAPGETLAARLARGPLPVADALGVALQIAEALEAAHERGIVHRDLKPANVAVDGDGAVKVLDFGLAKALAAEPAAGEAVAQTHSPTRSLPATSAGMLLGTAAYMSPEQAKGKPVDERADLWALGVVLLEMLTGRSPFQRETVAETLAAVLQADADLDSLPVGTPVAIRRLLRRCLASDARQRLHHAGDARLEITEALAGDEEHFAPTAVGAREKIRPATTWAALGVAAIGLAAVAGWLVARRGEAPPREEPPIHLPVSLPQGFELTFGLHSAVAISPDGRRLVLVAHGSDNVDVLVARDLGQLEPRVLVGTENAHAPFFSPDGEWVGYFTATELRRVPFAGGPAEPLADSSLDRGAAWSSDGTIVFAPRNEGGLVRLLASGGEPVRLTELDTRRGERTHRWPHVLPGADAVLFASDTVDTPTSYDDGRLEVVSVTSGERKVVVEQASRGVYISSGHLVFARGGSLFAAAFDLDRLELTTEPKVVLRGVDTSVTTGAVQLAVSETGSLLYVPGEASFDFLQPVWVTAGGALEPSAVAPGPYVNLALSPDGRRLALTAAGERRNDVWVADITLGTTSRLTFDGARNPTWAPDGRRIAYQRSHSATFGPEETQLLLWKAADGTGEEEVIWESETPISPNAFSPDGRSLIVHRGTADGSADLWLVPLEGRAEPTPLVSDPRSQNSAEVSPDGRWLAYASDESGRYEVYVRAFEGPGGKWQVSSAGGAEPHWAPDGSALYYRTRRNVMRVAVSLGDAFVAGVAEHVATGHTDVSNPRTYAITPDGRILLQALGNRSRRQAPVLVLGWAASLE